MSFTLEISYDFDFEIIGIVSSERSFKLAWLLNDSLHLDLARISDFDLDFSNGVSLSFANFIHRTEHNSYQLLKNKALKYEKTSKPFLLPELKQFDYLLRIDNMTRGIDIESVKQTLSSLSQIQLCQIINLEDVKEKENLIY
ncbi:MAG: hypothetical protein ACI85I_000905 [Arenicella sp.]|jgi:hypothetical protein